MYENSMINNEILNHQMKHYIKIFKSNSKKNFIASVIHHVTIRDSNFLYSELL